MQLDRVDINNFRSIKDLTLHFTQRCQSLIGINESGKSNILRALHLLDPQATASPKDLRMERHDEPQVTTGFVRFIFKLSDKDISDVTAKMAAQFCQQSLQEPLVTEKSTVKSLAEWCANRREGNYKITLPDGKRTETMWAVRKGEQMVPHWYRNKTSESVDVRIDDDTHLSVPAHGYVRVPSNVEPAAATFETATVDKLAALSIEAVRGLIVEQLPGCIFWRYADQYLLPSTIDMTAFCDSPDTCIPLKSMFELAGYDIGKLKETVTNAQAQGHYRYTQILEKTANAATEHIRSVWKDHKTIRLRLEPNGNSLSPMIVDDVVPLDMANRSDGFKRFVSFLLQISAKVRTSELTNTLILIDEPEIALHPTGAKSLMQELIKIGESNYVVYSTHSIFMIDKGNIGRHLVVEKKNEVTTTWRAEKSRIQDEEVLYSAIGYSIFETLREHNVIFEGWRDKELFRIVAESMGRADKQTKDMLGQIGVTFADGVKDVRNVAHFLQLASRPCLIISDAGQVVELL
ncbi:MAG: AAA family ATPase [Burkholderiaceae bacterium]